jgi:PAP2 superfamily
VRDDRTKPLSGIVTHRRRTISPLQPFFSAKIPTNALANAFSGKRHAELRGLMEETMGASIAYTLNQSVFAAVIAAGIAFGAPLSARANVITDWDETAVTVVMPMPPYTAQRVMGMVHVAMFDAVNSIERRYRPYLVQLTADPATSKEAAAATAAATVLATIDAKTAGDMRAALSTYLASIPDGAAKSDGVKLGEAVATNVVKERANDGADAPDDYRPRTTPGVYVPTSSMAASMWANVKPWSMTSPSQFRPVPPISLKSEEWAADFNELKDFGGRASAKRAAQQTETARFMALAAVGLNDALIAVFDAKYHYNFWRPLTAIRNGDIDGNPATDRDAIWQPIDNTPMHPEYPCAHCILSGCVAGVVTTTLGTADIPEVAMTSTTAPGVTHRWTNMATFAEEVANARIWSGFHYRFSTRVGTDMGLKIGEYVVKTVMQPVEIGSR